MALLLPNNQYVKFNLDGSYVIYETADIRLKNKKACSISSVIAKYSEILQKLFQDHEQMYYDPNYPKEIQNWVDEAALYKASVHEGNLKVKLPLIKKYIKNVNDTIPRIVSRGRLRVTATTIEGIYKEIKQRQVFGTIDEVKDI